MQPSNQLKGLVEAYSHVGSEETAQLKMYEKTVVNTIGVYMVSEGYGEDDVVEFFATASEGKIGDKFAEALDSGVATQYITEEGAFDTNLRYVEGAIYERNIPGSGMLVKAGQGLLNFVKSIPRRVTGFGAKPKVQQNPTSGTTIIKSTGNKRRIGTTAVGTGAVSAGLEDKDKEAIGRGIRRLGRAGGAAIEAGKKEYQKNSFEQEGDQIDEFRWPWDWGKDKKKDKKTEPASTTPSVNPRQILDRSREINRETEKNNDPLSKENQADRAERLRASQQAAAAARAKQNQNSGGGSTRDTAPTTPPRETVADVKPQKVSTIHTYKKHGSDLHVGRHRTLAQHRAAVAAQKAKKNEEVEVQEDLGKALNSLSKKLQTSDHPAARAARALVTPVGKGRKTARPAAGSTPGQEGGGKYTREMNEVELVTSFLVSEGFSDTAEGALVMLEGMSESWFNDILDVRLMEEAMLEYLQVMGEAESRDEALYIISEMDEEAIDILAEQVEDIMESMARSREFEKRLPEPQSQKARSREFEHGSTRSSDTPSGNLGDGLPRDKKGNIMR